MTHHNSVLRYDNSAISFAQYQLGTLRSPSSPPPRNTHEDCFVHILCSKRKCPYHDGEMDNKCIYIYYYYYLQLNVELLPINVDDSMRILLLACSCAVADGLMTIGKTPSVLSTLINPETTTLDTTWKYKP